MRKGNVLWLAAMLLLAGSTALGADSSTGVIYASAGTILNGKAISTSTVVAAGDQIRTGSKSVTVVLNGMTIQIPPNSSLVLGKDAGSVQVLSGSATVTQGAKSWTVSPQPTPTSSNAASKAKVETLNVRREPKKVEHSDPPKNKKDNYEDKGKGCKPPPISPHKPKKHCD